MLASVLLFLSAINSTDGISGFTFRIKGVNSPSELCLSLFLGLKDFDLLRDHCNFDNVEANITEFIDKR